MKPENLITRTTRYFTAEAGSEDPQRITIEATCREEKKLPAFVTLRFMDEEGSIETVEIPPEILERAGELMHDLRYEIAEDFRVTCAEHGYHEIGDCPLCAAEELLRLAPPEAA